MKKLPAILLVIVLMGITAPPLSAEEPNAKPVTEQTTGQKVGKLVDKGIVSGGKFVRNSLEFTGKMASSLGKFLTNLSKKGDKEEAATSE